MRSAQLQRFRYASMTAFEMSSNYLMLLIVSMGLAICSTERNSADVCMCTYNIYIYIILPHQRELLNSCCDSWCFRVLLVPCPVNSSTSHSKFIGLSLGQRNGLKVKVMNKQPTPWKPGRKAKISFPKIYPSGKLTWLAGKSMNVDVLPPENEGCPVPSWFAKG